MKDPVVVTGMGAITALGPSLKCTWEALLAGAQGIRPIRRFDRKGFPVQLAAEVSDLDGEGRDPNPGIRLETFQTRLLFSTCKQAMRQAGLEKAPVEREEIGFFVGLGAADYDSEEFSPAVLESQSPEGSLDYRAFFREHYRKVHPLWLLSRLNNMALCQVAIAADIRGDNTVLSQHGDAGAEAIAEGFYGIREGSVKVALVGGISEEVTPVSVARYFLMGVLSTASSEACRPFAADRSGTVLGEGGGVLVLERLSSALARNAPCLAEISGIGLACESEGSGTAPTSAAIKAAMSAALSAADIGPEAIDLILANGDGTPAGDGNEMAAIQELFDGCRDADAVDVLSVKGALGHLLAGAPLLEIALGVSMFREGVVPGMAADFLPDPACQLNLRIGAPVNKSLKRILVNSQGFAGQCTSIVLSAVDQTP